MKAVTFSTYGQPDEVCACTIVPDVGAPRGDEVVIEIVASAINPADLAMIKHVYPGPKPPAQLSIEETGRTVEIGAVANTLAVGDHVLVLIGPGGYDCQPTVQSKFLGNCRFLMPPCLKPIRRARI